METDFEERRARILDFIKTVHTGAVRAEGKVPDWHHLDQVSRILEFVLNDAGEGLRERRECVILAGLGHDALEDTDVSEEALEEYFGPHGLELIKGMTNTFGGGDVSPYVNQIMRSSEEVRLIKLADLYDNCTSVLYRYFELGEEWTKGYFLPIVDPMIEAVRDSAFSTYPVAGERLRDMVHLSRRLLEKEMERRAKSL